MGQALKMKEEKKQKEAVEKEEEQKEEEEEEEKEIAKKNKNAVEEETILRNEAGIAKIAKQREKILYSETGGNSEILGREAAEETERMEKKTAAKHKEKEKEKVQ